MAERKLGVLIHGAGWVATQHIQAFQHNPHTQVVAISSRKLESCRKRAEEAGVAGAAFYDNYEKALRHEGVDIVSVCTPQHLHAENTLAAAEAGKHIVIEKPAANSPEELRQMRDAVRKARVKTVVSFVLRWNPLFERVKALIAEDALGKVYYVEADYEHDIGSWWSGFDDARRESTGVSAMLVAGCHAVDAARWFAAPGRFEAAGVSEVFAYRGGWRKGADVEFNYFANEFQPLDRPVEYDGLEVVLLRFSNGCVGKVSVNNDCIQPYTLPIKVFGNKGTVRDNRVWSHKYPAQKDWVRMRAIMPTSADVSHHPFQAQMDHFVESILQDKESHCNLEDAVNTHEVVFAALRCYETGQPVKLPLLGD